MRTQPMQLMLSTVPDHAQAVEMANILVELRLAACVQIQSKCLSVYRWQDELCQSDEYVLLIKTSKQRSQEVHAWLKKHHRYDTPEILILDAQADIDYSMWLEGEVQGGVRI